MRRLLHRGLPLAVALAIAAGSLLSAPAAARGRPDNDRHRGRPTWGARDNRDRPSWRAPDHRGRPSWDAPRYRGRENRRPPIHRERPVYRYERHHRHGSPVVPFLGGLAIGAIIGNRPACPPPRPVYQRVYVYHCAGCDFFCRSYDAWTDHLIVVHGIPGHEIDRYYPPYYGGYWEDY